VKKQINPSIKAHLLRSALILLSLLVICAIPFALAQSRSRGTNNRSVANRTDQPQILIKFGGRVRVPAFQMPPVPKLPAVVLYDQLNNPGTFAVSSQEFPDFPAFTDFAADDFVVPLGQTWIITKVDALGAYLGPGPADNFNVFFYQNNGSLPAIQIYSATAQSYVNSAGVFQVTLTVPAVLAAGRYWVSMQAHMNRSPNGQWGWIDRTVQTNSPAAWQNPGGGFPAPMSCPAPGCPNPCPTCQTWGISQCCTGSPAGGPDQMFRLIGTIGGATPTPTATGTPSPIATATPSPTATATPIPTGTPIPTPGSCTSYEAESATLGGSAVVLTGPTCSDGHKVGYVGNNSGTLQFNGVAAGSTGRHVVTISYTNGDAVRYALLSVNGSAGTPLSFPSTGSFQTVGSIQTTITLNLGNNNTLMFGNPIVGNWAPDFDRLGVSCVITATPTPTPRPSATPTSTPAPTVTPTVTPTGSPIATDFNRDGFPDYLLFNPSSLATVIWYMNNNIHVSGNRGPDLPAGWAVAGVADFNGDGFPDYLLHNGSTGGTRIWYLRNNDRIGTVSGPTIPGGWTLVGTADFNKNGDPDFLLFNPSSLTTVIWYMDNNIHVSGNHGPDLPAGWNVAGVADFNGDGFPDYLLYNASTGGTRIWYLRNNDRIGTVSGPTIPGGWTLVGATDFNKNGHSDFLLFSPSSLATVIWYMNNNVHVGSTVGPTLPSGWALVAP